MHCHRIYQEIRMLGSGKRHFRRPLPMEVLYFMTAATDHVSMGRGVAVISGNFMERIDFNYKT
jgi:hypothetical protein